MSSWSGTRSAAGPRRSFRAGRYVYLCALLPMPGRSLADQFADDNPFVAGADDGRDRDDEGPQLT